MKDKDVYLGSCQVSLELCNIGGYVCRTDEVLSGSSLYRGLHCTGQGRTRFVDEMEGQRIVCSKWTLRQDAAY